MANNNAVAVANTFISRYGNKHIDHLKLQKLVYNAYGWWLVLGAGGQPLTNVRPQVWKLGPVFQPIYGAFAKFRDGWIPGPQPIGPFAGADVIDAGQYEKESSLIDWIWSRYGHMSGLTLSGLTHRPDTTWYKITKAHNFVVAPNTEMDDADIADFFRNLAKKEGLQ